MARTPEMIDGEQLSEQLAAEINDTLLDHLQFPFDLGHSEHIFAKMLGEQGGESQPIEFSLNGTSLAVSMIIEDSDPASWVEPNVAMLLAARNISAAPEAHLPNPINIFILRGLDTQPLENYAVRHVANITEEEGNLVIDPIDADTHLVRRFELPKGSDGKLEVILDGDRAQLRGFNIDVSQKV